MPKKQLGRLLEEIDAYEQEDLDEEGIEELEAVRDRIERMLERTEERSRAPEVALHIGGSANSFATRNPSLAAFLNGVSEALMGLGL